MLTEVSSDGLIPTLRDEIANDLRGIYTFLGSTVGVAAVVVWNKTKEGMGVTREFLWRLLSIPKEMYRYAYLRFLPKSVMVKRMRNDREAALRNLDLLNGELLLLVSRIKQEYVRGRKEQAIALTATYASKRELRNVCSKAYITLDVELADLDTASIHEKISPAFGRVDTYSQRLGIRSIDINKAKKYMERAIDHIEKRYEAVEEMNELNAELHFDKDEDLNELLMKIVASDASHADIPLTEKEVEEEEEKSFALMQEELKSAPVPPRHTGGSRPPDGPPPSVPLLKERFMERVVLT